MKYSIILTAFVISCSTPTPTKTTTIRQSNWMQVMPSLTASAVTSKNVLLVQQSKACWRDDPKQCLELKDGYFTTPGAKKDLTLPALKQSMSTRHFSKGHGFFAKFERDIPIWTMMNVTYTSFQVASPVTLVVEGAARQNAKLALSWYPQKPSSCALVAVYVIGDDVFVLVEEGDRRRYVANTNRSCLWPAKSLSMALSQIEHDNLCSNVAVAATYGSTMGELTDALNIAAKDSRFKRFSFSVVPGPADRRSLSCPDDLKPLKTP